MAKNFQDVQFNDGGSIAGGIHSVVITIGETKFKIIPTRISEGLVITKVADDMEDNILVAPKATNQIHII